jgi:hypothetical protein
MCPTDLAILVNGEVIEQWKSDKHKKRKIIIPNKILGDSENIVIVIDTPTATNPSSLEINNAQRVLAIVVYAIKTK